MGGGWASDMGGGVRAAVASDAFAPDVFVVVREAGERTASAARALAEAEVGSDSVTSIREVPFAAALRRGLELGVEAGRRWTLCLDADVLLRPGALADLVAAADQIVARDDSVLALNGTVADKLLGQFRQAGTSLYRTAHLPKALAEGPFDPKKRRPETRLKDFMNGRGHPWHNLDVKVGLHDHDQFFRDIFRKVFQHARKHARFIPYAERYWARMADADPDFRVALWSLQIARMLEPYAPRPGTQSDENIAIDVRGFACDFDAILTPAGMTEKMPLAPGDEPDVSTRLAGFHEAPEYLADRALARYEPARGLRGTLARRRHRPVIGPIIRALSPALFNTQKVP